MHIFATALPPTPSLPAPKLHTTRAIRHPKQELLSEHRSDVASFLQVYLHGSWGREAATGRGTVIATRELLKAAGAGEIRGKTIVIQVGAAAQETQSKPKKLNREKEDAFARAEKTLDFQTLKTALVIAGLW